MTKLQYNTQEKRKENKDYTNYTQIMYKIMYCENRYTTLVSFVTN